MEIIKQSTINFSDGKFRTIIPIDIASNLKLKHGSKLIWVLGGSGLKILKGEK